jgi:hypothetical protein
MSPRSSAKAGAFSSGLDHLQRHGRKVGKTFTNSLSSLNGLVGPRKFLPRGILWTRAITGVRGDLAKFFNERRTGQAISKWQTLFPHFKKKFGGKEVPFLEIGIYTGGGGRNDCDWCLGAPAWIFPRGYRHCPRAHLCRTAWSDPRVRHRNGGLFLLRRPPAPRAPAWPRYRIALGDQRDRSRGLFRHQRSALPAWRQGDSA